MNTISRLRAEAKEVLPKTSSVQQRRASLTQSHAATLGGSRAAKTSFSIKKPSSFTKATDSSISGKEIVILELVKTSLFENDDDFKMICCQR